MSKLRGQVRRKYYNRYWLGSGQNTCFYCHDVLSRNTRTIDHLLPISRGGKHYHTNLVLCCRTCNAAKSDMTLYEFCEFVARNGGMERTKLIFGNNSASRKHLLLEI